jgi:hypothetical protein
MSLSSFVTTRFGPGSWSLLQPWYDALSASDDLRLIQRNIDRECDRNDINALPWEDFLRDVIATHAGLDACQTIDAVLPPKRSYYTLAGKTLPALDDARQVYRFMRLDNFLKFNLSPMPIGSLTYPMLAEQINTGVITGTNLEAKRFGQTDYPIWCTLSNDPKWRASADRARDRFGLKHIDTGFLVEMAYTAGMLRNASVQLLAPTVLDSWAKGASNWFFAKKRGSGGPEWGYTVDLDGGGGCGRGSTEAVHADFMIPAGQGHRIGLMARGPIANSAPSVNFGSLLVNPAV